MEVKFKNPTFLTYCYINNYIFCERQTITLKEVIIKLMRFFLVEIKSTNQISKLIPQKGNDWQNRGR